MDDRFQPPAEAILRVALDDETLRRLADMIAARLADTLRAAPAVDGWLDARAASRYLGFSSTSPLHKLTARREIPFSREGDGGKLWFRAADLDAYRLQNLIPARDRRLSR